MGAYLETELKRKLGAEERAVLSRGADGAWARFEDDVIAFDLPDEPALQVKVVTPGQAERLRVVGGRVGSTDNRFSRVYKVTIGPDVPYLLILVSEADVFDEGICFCGHIAFERVEVRDGNARRFSLLPSGSVKKVQVLNDAKRAILMEWTHTALSRESYERVAASIRLKPSSALDEAAWMERLAPSGWARIGWIRRGDDLARVRELLGRETATEDGALLYVTEERYRSGDGRRHRLRVPMPEGRFAGLVEEPVTTEKLEPLPGSRAWADKMVRPQSSSGDDETPVGSPGELRRVMDLFKEQAPKAAPSEWDGWCWLVFKLFRHGVREESVLPIVKARFAEPGLSQFNAAWILMNYEAEGRDALFEGRIRAILAGATDDVSMELGNLYAHLGSDAPAFVDLMEAGLAHPNDSVRSAAILHGEKLPRDRARAAARRMLENDRSDHSRTMAAYLIRDVGLESDLAWLTPLVSRETKPQVRQEISEAVETISGKSRRDERMRSRRLQK